MNLNFSEEQLMLKEQIQKFCESDYDFYKREDVVKSEKDFDENVWNLFAEQGWLSMPFSEESGGFGFGAPKPKPPDSSEKGIDNQPCSANKFHTFSSKSFSDLTTSSLL